MERPVFVEISDEPLDAAISWTDKKTGAPRVGKPKQRAYLHGGGIYPLPFKVQVEEAGPLRPGRYLLAGESFKVGDFDGLEFLDRRFKLLPLDDAIRALTSTDQSAARKVASAA